MNTGPGCVCQPVDDPGSYACWRTTMSVGAFVSALKSPGPCGYDRSLKLSYVPRARTVGVTPLGGEASAMLATVPATIAAESSPVRMIRFKSLPPCRVTHYSCQTVFPRASPSLAPSGRWTPGVEPATSFRDRLPERLVAILGCTTSSFRLRWQW